MSFLANALAKQKEKLKQTETVLTTADGRKFLEKGDTKVSIESNSQGFVVDTKPDRIPARITEHLFLGSQDCTEDSVVAAHDIQHVLSLGINVDVTVNNKFVECLDLPETDLREMLLPSLPFIRAAVEKNENVLVHCNAGVSRAPTVAIAYLMHYDLLNFESAYSLVKERRPAIQPNAGFRKQLQKAMPGRLI